MTEEGSPASTPDRLASFSAMGACVLAACLYVTTVCPAADAGLSARLIASHFGLFPRY